jgi:SOS-response transcriptional repressor LexA
MSITCPTCAGAGTIERDRLPLTIKQKAVLDYIVQYQTANKIAPSFNDIAAHFGYSSLATVHEYLTALEAKGYIARGYNQQRCLTVLTGARQENH